MAIVEVRIDDRLIHGQVSTLWIPHLAVERLLIVDDEVAVDDDRKAILHFATPPQCKLSIFDAAKAAEKLTRGIDEGVRVMIVCASPVPLATMLELGYAVHGVTVGNMSRRDGTRELAKTAYVDDVELAAFDRLVAADIPVVLQPTPTSRKEHLAAAIAQLSKGH
jgi:PTS system mannose-specific IIB component